MNSSDEDSIYNPIFHKRVMIRKSHKYTNYIIVCLLFVITITNIVFITFLFTNQSNITNTSFSIQQSMDHFDSTLDDVDVNKEDLIYVIKGLKKLLSNIDY